MLGTNQHIHLTHEYPSIFNHRIDIAQAYLTVVENIETMDQEFTRIQSGWQQHSNNLLDFFNTKIQFQSPQHFKLVLDDIIRFANACLLAENQLVKKLSDAVIKEANKILEFIPSLAFVGFDFTNYEYLSELNRAQVAAVQASSPPLLLSVSTMPGTTHSTVSTCAAIPTAVAASADSEADLAALSQQGQTQANSASKFRR